MRWLMSALSVVGLCAGAVLSISIIVAPESAWSERSAEVSAAADQYSNEDQGNSVELPQGGTPASLGVGSPETEPPIRLAQEGDAAGADATEDSLVGSSGSVSEGSVAGAGAPPPVALSRMEPPAPYSQLVDNSSVGWFSGRRGWEVKRAGTKAQPYGLDYSYAEPSEVGHPARFRVNIPATDYYTVYARWPSLKRNNAATLFGVSTTTGIEWTEVDQRRDGGMWVRLGAYEMEAGERYAVQVSGYRATGWVVADAVMVVRGTQMAPPETDPGAVGALETGRGQDVVQLAREHIGTPYIHSPPGSCEAYRSEDCSCLTSLVFAEGLEITMPDDPVVQWDYGRDVAKSELLPGDLIFFKEAGPSYPITHVGIYSGMGNVIHASSYWGTVVERPMEYIDGYYGAKRLDGN